MPEFLQRIRPSHQILIAAIFGILGLVTSFASDEWRRYDEDVARSGQAVRTAATLLAEHTARIFDSVETVLQTAARLHADASAGNFDRSAVHRLLRAIQGSTPVFKSIGWLDGDGNVIASSQGTVPPHVNLAESEAFQALRNAPVSNGDVYVAAPMRSQVFGTPVIGVGLRTTTADGRFDGAVYGLVDPAYFTHVFNTADVGASAVITLFSGDGVIMARQPNDASLIGTSLAGRPFMTDIVARDSAGIFQAHGLSDGEHRLIGYAKSADGRFILTVALRMDEVTAEFRDTLMTGTIRLFLTVLVLCLGTWFLVREVERRERLTAELQASEQRLRDFAESSSDWFWETDAEHRFTWLSPGAERAGGVPPEWHYGKRRMDMIASDALPQEVVEEHERTLNAKLPFRDFEYPRRGPNGDRWIRVSGLPQFDAEGQFVGYRGSSCDVTELVAARHRLREAVSAIPGDFLLFDAGGRLVFKNDSVDQLEEVRGFDRIGDTFEAILRRAVAAGVIHEAVDDPEDWIRQRLAFHRKASGSIVTHNKGRAIEIFERPTSDGGIMALRFDVTDRERALQAVQEARKAADEANRAKSEFLASMSHELRTPLNAIIGFGQILRRGGAAALTLERHEEYSGYIVSSGEHLLSLVNDVLDLAGIEAGRLRLSLEPVPVARVIDQALSSMRPLAERKAIRVEAIVDADAGTVRADEQRLLQVILNLTSNAIKYNRMGGSVTVTAALADGRVRIAVTDDGSGIPKEKAEQLFIPFQRLGAEFTKIEGTGIGLALSKRLVEAMDGAIGHIDVQPHGSTFWVELPDAEDRRVVREPIRQSDLAPNAAAGGFSLLCVEDNPLNLRLLEHLIDSLPDVTMHSAPSGSLGLELAAAHLPDVIVLDLNLPGMDGFEVLRRLRAQPETRDTPVIALTASAMPNDVARGMRAGFFRYLTKPLDFDAFLAAVDAALSPGDVRPQAPDRNAPAPRAAAGPDDLVLDPRRVEELRKIGRSGKLLRSLATFGTEVEARIAELRALQATGDLEAVRRAAHTLKGLSLNFGARRVGSLSGRIEALAKSGDGDALPAALADLDEAGRLTAEAIARVPLDPEPPAREAGT